MHNIIVATTVIGAGIDLPSVTTVARCGSPDDLIDYMQESERAGRNNQPAQSHVFYNSTSTTNANTTCYSNSHKS